MTDIENYKARVRQHLKVGKKARQIVSSGPRLAAYRDFLDKRGIPHDFDEILPSPPRR